jgi:hypothetical protein
LFCAFCSIISISVEWFPNGSPHEKSARVQTKRINQAADVIRALNQDILLLQEIKDYETCHRLADAIKPDSYKVAICSALKQGRGTGRQQVAILATQGMNRCPPGAKLVIIGMAQFFQLTRKAKIRTSPECAPGRRPQCQYSA